MFIECELWGHGEDFGTVNGLGGKATASILESALADHSEMTSSGWTLRTAGQGRGQVNLENRVSVF